VVNKGKEKYKDKEGKVKEREKYSLVVEG